MRRAKQQLSDADALKLLKEGTSGVLALNGEYPYAVPLSYVYEEGAIYFHCAKSGHKLDLLKACARASFCVIGKDQVISEEFTTYFRSMIVFGTVEIIEEEAQLRSALRLLAAKYSPRESEAHLAKEIEGALASVCILKLHVEEMSGKEAVELMRQRTKCAY